MRIQIDVWWESRAAGECLLRCKYAEEQGRQEETAA